MKLNHHKVKLLWILLILCISVYVQSAQKSKSLIYIKYGNFLIIFLNLIIDKDNPKSIEKSTKEPPNKGFGSWFRWLKSTKKVPKHSTEASNQKPLQT